MPAQPHPLWLTLVGITHGNDSRQNMDISSAYTLIEYVFSGTGKIQVGEETYDPTAGDVCIISEKTTYCAVADHKDPWVKMVLHLKGTAAASFVQAFDLDKRILHKSCSHLQGIFEEIFFLANSSKAVEEIMEQSGMLLMKLLSSLCNSGLQDRSVSDEVRTVKRFIENNYHRELNMDDIAASVYRSKDYVQKIFKHEFDVTPYNYYMELKMECAKNLLLQTNLSVAQIAEKLGFNSDRYFSARFRRAMGITAVQFRKQRQVDKYE